MNQQSISNKNNRDESIDVSEMGDYNVSTRRWVFTFNNYTAENIMELQQYPSQYTCFSQERAPTTGTPHLQGYFRFKSAKAWKVLHKAFPNMWMAKANGTEKQCREYCSGECESKGFIKNGTFWERGEPTSQGERTDISRVSDAILGGAQLDEVAMDFPEQYIRYHRGFERLAERVNRSNFRPNLEVYWIWGGTGVGKTRFVYENETNLYIKDNTRWWNVS